MLDNAQSDPCALLLSMVRPPSSKQLAPAATKRLRGRPSTQAGLDGCPALSTEFIIDTALELCQEVPLADLSIVHLAREIGVTPASLHYYLDGRNGLVSGVISKYFELLLPCFELGRSDTWEPRVRRVATALYHAQVQYKGVTSYFISHNKFRLVQDEAPTGKGAFGIRYLESMLQLFLDRPFPVKAAVANSHHLVRFIGASAHSAGGKQLPGQHGVFIEDRLSCTDPREFPAVHKALKFFVAFGADEAFKSGLAILLRGFLDE